MQQTLDFSRQLRDEGAAKALKNAGQEWHDKAVQIALRFFANAGHDGALFEEVREFATRQGLDEPPSPNAWGAVCLAMSKRNLIAKTGQLRASRSARSHSRAQPVWRLASLEAAA
jgi:hypothetical protein